MKEEIQAAVKFISKLVSQNANVTNEKLSNFESCLEKLMEQRFSNHWFPDQPWRGQGFRCLRVNENSRTEQIINQAANECGLKYDDLKLPVELTIWVDPENVSVRFGEQKGSCCTVASFREGNKENFIEMFDFSELQRSDADSPDMFKPIVVLKDKTVNSKIVGLSSSPPSSTQSTPTKKKPLSQNHASNRMKNPLSLRGSAGNINKKPFNNSNTNIIHPHQNHYIPNNHQNNHHHHSNNGSYSLPFYETNSWLNLRQTPPPTHHLPPIYSSTGFIYPPSAPPQYTNAHSQSHFNRSPPSMGHQKFKWSSPSYSGNDRHQWFSHRALARV